MVQVINDPNRNRSLGGSLSTGLNSALQGLVEHKVGQIQQKQAAQRTASGLQSLLGIPAKEAHQLAALDPKILEQVVKQKLQAPQEEAFAQALSGLLGTEQQGQTSQAMQTQPSQQMGTQSQQPVPDNVVGQYTPWHMGMTEEEKLLSQIPSFLASEEGKQLSPEQRQYLQAQVPTQPGASQQETGPQQAKPRLNAKNALELAKLGQTQKKIEQRERKLSREESKDIKEIIQPLLAKKNDALERLEDINRRKELEDEGLDTAGYSAFLERSGLDINALRNPGSTEYNKTVASAIRGAKEMFGGRATDTDVKLFMKTLPSLQDSPEGRKRIDANLARFANLDVAIADAYVEALKENPRILPAELLIEVDKKVDKKREQVYKQFKKDLDRPVPEAQHRGVTAAQAVAGSIVGAPGQLLNAIGGFFGKGGV